MVFIWKFHAYYPTPHLKFCLVPKQRKVKINVKVGLRGTSLDKILRSVMPIPCLSK